MSRSIISKLVRSRRKQLDLTQAEAAKKVGLSPNYFGMIDRGYPTHVSVNVANKLIKKLGVRRQILSALDSQNIAAAKDSRFWRKRMELASKKRRSA